MAAIAGTIVSAILNWSLPTGTSGAPGATPTLAASSMKIRLNSGTSTALAAGTELSGTGYTAGGSNITASSGTSASGGPVTLPNVAGGMSWTNGGAAWSIASLDITDSAGNRSWFGLFTGQPIAVASANTFQIAQNAITVNLT